MNIMKYLISAFSLIFLLQSGGIGQAFSLFIDSQAVTQMVDDHCADEHSETHSTSDDCSNCFHMHTCCHAKLVALTSPYEWTPYFNNQIYQDFRKLLMSQPFLEGPFQPPKQA